MLQVAVHGNHDFALGFVEARRKRRGLPEVAPQPDHLQMAIGLHQVGQQLEAAVSRGIVYKYNLVGPPELFEHNGQAVVQRKD